MPNMYKIITVKANRAFSGYEVSGSTARSHNIGLFHDIVPPVHICAMHGFQPVYIYIYIYIYI